jgi:hypothetical protein
LVVHSCKDFILKTCPKIESKSQNHITTWDYYKVLKLTRTRNFLTENVLAGGQQRQDFTHARQSKRRDCCLVAQISAYLAHYFILYLR